MPRTGLVSQSAVWALVALAGLTRAAAARAAPVVAATKPSAPAVQAAPRKSAPSPAPPASPTPSPAPPASSPASPARLGPTTVSTAAEPADVQARTSYPFVLSLGAQLYWDGGSVTDTERRSIATADGSFEFKNDGHLSVAADLSKQLGSHVRVGGGLRYYFLYDYTRKDDQASTPKVFRLGNLLDVLGRLDYLVAASEKLGFAVGGHGGPVILFPSGEFQTSIDDLQNEGVHVWDTPRLGYVVGVHAGVRYRVHERIYVRPELDLSWEHLFLFGTKQTVTGVPFEKKTSAAITRTSFALAIELVL